MTTNQTIDGVPRELVEMTIDLLQDLRRNTAIERKLRALLDAPVTGWKVWGKDRCDQCCNGDRCEDASHVERSKCQYCKGTGMAIWMNKLAAQPQSEPVPDILPGLEYAWKHFDGLSTSQLITLQAMIAEAKRMSASVVRPHHANPPPGTEPSGTHPHNDGLDEMRKPK